ARFEPNEAQREAVSQMAAGGMTLDEIAALVINPATAKPVKRDTLTKAFVAELAAGRAGIKALAIKNLHKALEAGDWKSTQWALENINGISRDTANKLNISLGFQPPQPVFIDYKAPDALTIDAKPALPVPSWSSTERPQHLHSNTANNPGSVAPDPKWQGPGIADYKPPKQPSYHDDNYGAGPGPVAHQPAFRGSGKKGSWMA